MTPEAEHHERWPLAGRNPAATSVSSRSAGCGREGGPSFSVGRLEELADACASLAPGILAAVADGRIGSAVSLADAWRARSRRQTACATSRRTGAVVIGMP